MGQLFRRLLQLEEVICFLFLPSFFLSFFSGAPCFSPAELISWKGEDERLWCPLLSYSAPWGQTGLFRKHWTTILHGSHSHRLLKVFSVSVGQMRSRKGQVCAERLLSGQRDMARWQGPTCSPVQWEWEMMCCMAELCIMLRWSTSSMCHGWESCINGALLPTHDSKIETLKYAHFK